MEDSICEQSKTSIEDRPHAEFPSWSIHCPMHTASGRIRSEAPDSRTQFLAHMAGCRLELGLVRMWPISPHIRKHMDQSPTKFEQQQVPNEIRKAS